MADRVWNIVLFFFFIITTNLFSEDNGNISPLPDSYGNSPSSCIIIKPFFEVVNLPYELDGIISEKGSLSGYIQGHFEFCVDNHAVVFVLVRKFTRGVTVSVDISKGWKKTSDRIAGPMSFYLTDNSLESDDTELPLYLETVRMPGRLNSGLYCLKPNPQRTSCKYRLYGTELERKWIYDVEFIITGEQG